MGIALLVFLLVIGPLALLGARDSRIDEHDRRNSYLG